MANKKVGGSDWQGGLNKAESLHVAAPMPDRKPLFVSEKTRFGRGTTNFATDIDQEADDHRFPVVMRD